MSAKLASDDYAIRMSRQLRITVGDPTGIVRSEREGHLVPSDVDIGVVIEPLSDQSHPCDEPHRGHEIGESERPPDRVPVALPLRVLPEKPFDLEVVERVHLPKATSPRRLGSGF